MKFQGIELRDYTENEILNEKSELDSKYYDDVRDEAIKVLNKVNELPYESVEVNELENVDCNVAGYEKTYGWEYYLGFHSLSKAESFPAPVILKKDDKSILLGGNRRTAVLFLLSPNKQVPCKVINI